MDDKRMDGIIANILRLGVSIAAILVLLGGVQYLGRAGRGLPEYSVFRPARFHGGLMESGLLVLILTPVTRVAFSVLAFAYERDWTYVAVTLIVLALLAVGWFGGHAA